MKKIIFLLMSTLFVFTSCVKNKEIYRGDSKQFNYSPSWLNPVMVGVPVNGIAIVLVGNRQVSIQCITPGNPVGDAIVVDAPVFPAEWEWFNTNGVDEYRPSGMVYNSAGGFSANYGRCWFVEIFANGTFGFRNGVSIPMDPVNAYAWVNSFEYPRTWVQTLPIMAKVVKSTPTNYRLVIP